MEHNRFDDIARQFGSRLPRRGVLGLVAALTAARVVGSPEDGTAKSKHRKTCPTGQQRCAKGKHQPCVGCCTDADCGGNACLGGECAACQKGQRSCRGGCIAVDACCTDADCTGGRVCVEGRCDCRASERLCQGTCIPRTACCGTDCPPTPQPPQPPPATCTPANCNGCCDGTTCREGVTVNNCGRGGVTCATCRSGEVCDAERCVCPTECCGDVDCTEGDAGLCRPDGTCVYRPDCVEAGQVLPNGCPGGITACCSGGCAGTGACVTGEAGRQCHSGADCDSGDCQFYRCV